MPYAYKSILSFFQLVADVPGYEELEQFGIGMDNKEARSVKCVQEDGDETTSGPSVVISKAKEAANWSGQTLGGSV